MFYLTPFLAVVLTLLAGIVLFEILRKPPLEAMRLIFVQPLTSVRGLAELLVKGTPLILIAIGLAVGFRGGIWNIGAEGQFAMARWPAGPWRWRSIRPPGGGCCR
jgi:simple sugar transport system permease protein